MAGLLVLVVTFGAMYLLLIMPQQRKVKAQRELLNALSAGDPVVTTGGIFGVVTEIEGDALYLEVAPDIELKVLRSAVTAIVRDDETPPAEGGSADKQPGKSPKSARGK